MTRTRWTGLLGVLTGVLLLGVGMVGGTTPDTGDSDSAAKFLTYWKDDDHQSRARLGALLLTYVFVVLLLFVSGLHQRLRAADRGPFPAYARNLGIAGSVLVLAGGEASFMVGVAAADSSGFKPDGNVALLFDDLAYSLLAPGLMALAIMVVFVSLSTLRTRLLPVWTAWLGFLVGLGALGSFFTAWTGFFLFPVWAVVVGVVLLLSREVVLPADPVT